MVGKYVHPTGRWLLDVPEKCPSCKVGDIKIVAMEGNVTAICELNCDRRVIQPAYRSLRKAGADTLPGFDDEAVGVQVKRQRKQVIS